MSSVLAWTAFVLGTFLCLTNFYLSVLRYLLHRFSGLSRESYHWVSGIPLIGSLLVALSLLGLYALPGMLPAAIALIAIDTGGIHWLVGIMIYQSVYRKKQKHG